MKLTIDRKHLLEKLSAASAVTPTKTPMDVLRYVKIDVGERASLAATNLEVWLSDEIACTVESPGVALLDSGKLLGPLRAWSCESVRLESDNGKVRLIGERGDVTLNAPPADTFPAEAATTGDGGSLRTEALRVLITEAEQSTNATDSAKHAAYGGVRFEAAADKLTCVACDGVTLSYDTAVYDGKEFTALVPANVMRLIKSLPSGQCSITTDSNRFCAAVNGTRITARQLEARYPKWRDIAPPPSKEPIKIDRKCLLECLAATFVHFDQLTSRAVDLEFKLGVLSLSSQAELGNAVATMPYSGPDFSVRLNQQYLKRFLDLSEAIAVELHKPTDRGHVLLTDGGWNYVIAQLEK